MAALNKKCPRPPIEDVDRAFWVALRQSWLGWASRLLIVKADTVAEWNRARFRRYWTRISSTRYPILAAAPSGPRPGETMGFAFLRNHKDDIAAMDLFTVPAASLRMLYGFFVVEHGRRHIVHFNATFHPTAACVMQQLREAFPYETAPKYLIFDRDRHTQRAAGPRPSPKAKVVALPREGGLHRRYEWREAA